MLSLKTFSVTKPYCRHDHQPVTRYQIKSSKIFPGWTVQIAGAEQTERWWWLKLDFRSLWDTGKALLLREISAVVVLCPFLPSTYTDSYGRYKTKTKQHNTKTKAKPKSLSPTFSVLVFRNKMDTRVIFKCLKIWKKLIALACFIFVVNVLIWSDTFLIIYLYKR